MGGSCDTCKFIDECEEKKKNPKIIGCCLFGGFTEDGLICNQDDDKETKGEVRE